MNSLVRPTSSGDYDKSDLYKPPQNDKILIIPDTDVDEERSKTPLAETNFGILDEALSLRSQLHSLHVDDAVGLCISILRSSIAISTTNDETISEQLRIALRFLTKLPDPADENNFALNKFACEYNGLDILVELLRQPDLSASLDAIRALYRVASYEKYTDLAVEAGIPKTVVDIVANPANVIDSRILCDGLLLLGNLAFHPEARAVIGQHGGVQVVLD